MFHCLARETGRIGHLYSPDNHRGPWPWFPYALDNGVFPMWNPADNSFDEERWMTAGEPAWRRMLFWAQSAPQKPRWLIVPDRPGDKAETIRKWRHYAGEAKKLKIAALAVAVQDGMEMADVLALRPEPEVVCVGGSTEWKWDTAPMWCAKFPRVHVLRCNSPEKLYQLESWGCESTDGTGWNRGDRNQTFGLEAWARTRATPTFFPLTPHVCRKERIKGQTTFA